MQLLQILESWWLGSDKQPLWGIITSHYSVVNERYESLQQRNTLAIKWGSVIKAPGKTAKDFTQRQERKKAMYFHPC